MGEGHVARADHERDHEVAKRPRQERDDHEEDHDRRVHREELVVKLRRHLVPERRIRPQQPAQDRHRLPRPGELPAHRHRQQSADDEEDQAGEEKLDADDLVVGREDVARQEPRRRRMNVIVVAVRVAVAVSVVLAVAVAVRIPVAVTVLVRSGAGGAVGRVLSTHRLVLEFESVVMLS
jgi:hypothetical protein